MKDKTIKAILSALYELDFARDCEQNTTKQNTITTAMLILQEAYKITK